MKLGIKWLGTFAFGAAAALAVMFAVDARAAGIPDADVFTYTGYLEDGDGTPLIGDHSIAVRFWKAETGGLAVCSGEVDTVSLVAGRFQVPLQDECEAVAKANPTLFVDVVVDGASLGRTKLGAVPFAVEAGHSTVADAANAAAGELEDRIAGIEARLGPQSAFRAMKTSAQAIPHQNGQVVVFDQELFDVNDEYDAATGKFTVKTAGYYALTCQATFNDLTAGRGLVHLMLNDADPVAQLGFVSTGESGRLASSTVHLAKGDAVTCTAYQDSGAASALRVDIPYVNVFTGTRIGGLE